MMMNPHKTFTYLAVASALLLGSCTVGGPAPDDHGIETSVAATLTAFPTSPPTFAPSPSPTNAPTSTYTPSPTLTPTLTPSPTLTPTATSLPPSDPRYELDLDQPDYLDPFDDTTRWFHGYGGGGYSDDWVAFFYDDGVFSTTDKRADRVASWSTSVRSGTNFYLEITASVAQCAGKDSAGVAIRVGGENLDQAYTLEVSCDGAYRLRKFIDIETSPEILLNWTVSEAIVQGPNASNRLGLLAQGGSLHAFVNDQPLTPEALIENEYLSGKFGLFANALETTDLTVTFDDFALWNLTP